MSKKIIRKTIKSRNLKKISNVLNFNNLFNNNKIIKNKITKNNKIKKIHTKLNYYNKNYELFNKIVNNFYNFDNTINTHLITYNDNETQLLIKKGLTNFKLCKSYSYDILNEYFDKISLSYKVKEKLLNSLNISRAPIEIINIVNDFTRGVSTYININYKDKPIKISNAFCKLWEILEVFDTIIPKNINNSYKKQKFKVFHIAEAPGNMIECAKYFVKKRSNIKLNNYEWKANSLNPNNLKNQEIYGKGNIFDDEYKLMKKNPDNWLWGEDDTGDITNTMNIKWFKNYINTKWLIHKNDKLNLICGDGGLKTDYDPILLQKLDLAQVIMVLACSSIGGSCIIKHFTPYIKRHSNTYEASGFFIGFLYLYFITFEHVNLFKPYTSNPDSGEFYVIGTGFKGIEETQLTNLYEILDNFKLNDGIIKKEDIPESFVIQINGFLEKISNLNTINIEKQNLLLNCYKENQDKTKNYYKKTKKNKIIKNNVSNIYINEKLYCNKLLNKNTIKELLIPRYKEWIKMYNFE
jgi:hypothetical protein